MNCTKCGTSLPEGSVFCPSCGAKLNVQPVTQQAHEQQPVMQPSIYSPAPKKSKAPWIALGVSLILIIAIIAIVIILLFSCSSNEINESPTAVVTGCLTSVTSDDVDTFMQTVYPTIIKQYKAFGYNEDEIFEGLGASLLDEEDYDKFSNIKLTDSEPLDSGQLTEYNEYLENMDGYVEVLKLYQVYGTLDAKTDNDSEELSFNAIVAQCADDNYYIFEIYID